MVVLLDLDDDDGAFDPFARPTSLPGLQTPSRYDDPYGTVTPDASRKSEDTRHGLPPPAAATDRPNPNLNHVFSTALACYPIVTLLTSSLDLNTLHALSLTCRQFRHNLLQHRSLLIQQTLRCANDQPNLTTTTPLGTKRTGACARDLVSGCRRCALTVCRNCTAKPPPPWRLHLRHRRLCVACLGASLPALTRRWRDPCTCAEGGVFLCVGCGTGLAVADTSYQRIWTWRTRYSTYLGGLGTGIGEGTEGVKCWRGDKCVAAQEVEVEYCFEEEGGGGRSGSGSGGESSEDSEGERYWGEGGEVKEERAGYWQQEIEGIGGRVKKKVKKRVRVGKTVKEWEDERDGKEEALGRESRGEARSWCGWCGRVVWSQKDREEFGGALST
ncbi:MAG: hypothetical protein LQ344_002042 [Seirophora lacunosa]|nr:MAG: hypothetical protein LQ344_002042 [Seirophora lacunosa]